MKQLRLIMISQYGSGLSNPAAQFSGALARQKDYTENLMVEKYHMIVPAVGSEEVITISEKLSIHPIVAKNPISFLRKARKKARSLHVQHNYTHCMVDNPHTAGVLGILLKHDLKIPLVVHSMSDMIRNKWYRRERLSNYFKSILIELVVWQAAVIRVSTQTEYDRHQRTHFAHKVHKVSFYIDQINIMNALEDLTELQAQPKQLLYVGRLGPQKDVKTLIRAMRVVAKEHADAHLTIVGGGPDEHMLKKLTTKLGLESYITFTGPVPYERVMQYFIESSAFVISSLHEGTCMVLHEAGLAQKPIVSTAHSGAVDLVVENINGLLAPIGNHKILAEKISILLADASMSQQMGVENYNYVRKVDRAYALSEWRALCDRLQHMLSNTV